MLWVARGNPRPPALSDNPVLEKIKTNDHFISINTLRKYKQYFKQKCFPLSPKILFNLSGEQETSCQILISRRSQVSQVVFFPSLMYLLFYRYIKFKTVVNFVLRCLDTVFQGPYRYFSIALKVVFSLSDRYKIFTSNWLWIEICEM